MQSCVRCQMPLPAKSRRHYCDDCRRASYAENRYLSQSKILELGRCRNCYKPRGKDGTGQHCRPCAAAVNAYSLERRRKLIEAGRCSLCRKLRGPAGTKTFCGTCAANEAIKKRERRGTR